MTAENKTGMEKNTTLETDITDSTAAITERYDPQKFLIRTLVDTVYDAQSARISMGNRLVASMRSLGLVPETDKQKKAKERQKKPVDATHEEEGTSAENIVDGTDAGLSEKDKRDKENNKILAKLLGEYKRVTDLYATKYDSKGSIAKVLADESMEHVMILTDLTYQMVSNYKALCKVEEKMTQTCAKEVQRHPMYEAFFKDVRGCGPLMSAVCIAYLDPYKARFRSSFYRYCGLDVVIDENGAHGRSRKDAYMVEFIDKDGKVSEKKSLGYNPKVKTKLVGVLGSSFLRSGGKYAQLYYNHKNQLQNRPDCKDLTPLAIHRRANRYMVKAFLADLWVAWRTLEGLPVGEDYAVAKLGMLPHHHPRNIPVSEG